MGRGMNTRLLTAALLWGLTVSSGSCTRIYRQENLPNRPKSVKGWKVEAFDGVTSMAQLLLDEGQSSEDEKIGVAVVSISPYETRGGLFDHPTGPTAVLRFYRVSDHMVIQQRAESTGGSTFSESALSEYGINAIYVDAINTKERWVWFELRH
jgi:hypothetical protein